MILGNREEVDRADSEVSLWNFINVLVDANFSEVRCLDVTRW